MKGTMCSCSLVISSSLGFIMSMASTRSAIRCRDAIRIGGVAYFSDCIFLCPGKGSVSKDLHKRIVFTDLVALGRRAGILDSGPHGTQSGVVGSERRGSGRIVGKNEAATRKRPGTATSCWLGGGAN